MGLRQLACWDCEFESRWGHAYLSLVSVVSCQVEVFASGLSLVQRSPTECGASECDREASIMWSWPTVGFCAMETEMLVPQVKKKIIIIIIMIIIIIIIIIILDKFGR